MGNLNHNMGGNQSFHQDSLLSQNTDMCQDTSCGTYEVTKIPDLVNNNIHKASSHNTKKVKNNRYVKNQTIALT